MLFMDNKSSYQTPECEAILWRAGATILQASIVDFEDGGEILFI